ncbi:archaemetzincin family Zn-dependent metalloprotease [Hydrogenivirga sp.]
MGYIYMTSFGGVENRLLIASARNVKEVFGLEVRLSSVPFPPRLGLNPVRNQYHAGALLSYLRQLSFPELVRMLALVDFDLYEEGLNFVFGEAELGGRNAVVSVFRLRHPNERVTFDRTFKEVNHEIGHTFGLTHCADTRCVMSFSNSLADVDRKTRYFCKTCLNKLNSALAPYR